jgi:NADH:ubiquinone oxidoreductase subunit F (NADH-binding)
MRYNPHALIEGMAIAAYAMGCRRGYNTSMAKSGTPTSDARSADRG